MHIQAYLNETRKIIGVGPNFKAFRAQKGITHEEDPFLFMKSPQSLTVETDIYLPPQLTEFICEVEMAVIIGQEARNVAEEDVASIVAGYAIANDITASAHFDTGRFKMFDQMTPIGQMVSLAEPHQVVLEMWVNGNLIQRDHTSNLLFSSNWLISHISRMTTLCKGDIILTGTPSNPMTCQIGDVIEMKSPQLGNHRFTIHKEL